MGNRPRSGILQVLHHLNVACQPCRAKLAALNKTKKPHCHPRPRLPCCVHMHTLLLRGHIHAHVKGDLWCCLVAYNTYNSLWTCSTLTGSRHWLIWPRVMYMLLKAWEAIVLEWHPGRVHVCVHGGASWICPRSKENKCAVETNMLHWNTGPGVQMDDWQEVIRHVEPVKSMAVNDGWQVDNITFTIFGYYWWQLEVASIIAWASRWEYWDCHHQSPLGSLCYQYVMWDWSDSQCRTLHHW